MTLAPERLVPPIMDLLAMAAHHIRRSMTQAITVEGDDSQMVTNVDHEVDLMMRRGLAALTPTVTIDTEESGAEEQGSDLRWVVDPVDGTQNLGIHLPLVGVSVALLDHRDVCHLAGVADPVGGRVLAGAANVLRLRSASEVWGSESVADPVLAAGPRGLRRVGLLRGNAVSRDDESFTDLLMRLSRSTGRVLQSRSPVVDLFLMHGGGLDAMVCVDCTGYEMPAVVYLARRLGATLVPKPAGVPGSWGLPRSYVLARPDCVEEVCRLIGWQEGVPT